MPNDNPSRDRISDATKESTSWFGQAVYAVNGFLKQQGVPLSDQSADFVITNADNANEGRIFSSTAHRREAFHWWSERRSPQNRQLKTAIWALDPNWFTRGFVLNSAASLYSCLDPSCEGQEFASTGVDPGIDTYNLFIRANGRKSLFDFDSHNQ